MPWVRPHWRNRKGQAVMDRASAQPTLFDVPLDPCARRHGGDPESAAAFRATRSDSQRETVYAACCELHARFRRGVTLDEVAAWMEVPPNRISGRISELTRRGLLLWTGLRRLTRAHCVAKVYVPANGGTP